MSVTSIKFHLLDECVNPVFILLKGSVKVAIFVIRVFAHNATAVLYPLKKTAKKPDESQSSFQLLLLRSARLHAFILFIRTPSRVVQLELVQLLYWSSKLAILGFHLASSDYSISTKGKFLQFVLVAKHL